MAKDLPYFKFYPTEWMSGDITLEDLKTQGLFINICCYYWSQECQVSLEKLQKRFKNNKKQIQNLINEEIIYSDSLNIKIKFLDEQFEEREAVKHRNKANGIKGGRPKKNQSVNSGLAKNNPNITNIEEKRGEEKREDLKSKPKNNAIDPKETAKPKPDAFSRFFEVYPKRFNPMCPKVKNSFFQAVSIADGEDVILVAASMYADYFEKTGEPIQYASSVENWLDSQSWKTDWSKEISKKKDQGSKSLSTSPVSVIKEGDKF